MPTPHPRHIAAAARVAAKIDAQRRQIAQLRTAVADAVKARREAELRAQRASEAATRARRERDEARAVLKQQESTT